MHSKSLAKTKSEKISVQQREQQRENEVESIKPDNKIPTILIMIINLNRFSIPSRRLRFGLKKKNPDNKK